MEPADVVDSLPLKQRATTKELVYLAIVVIALLGTGGAFTWTVKDYLSSQHNETLAAVAAAAIAQQAKIDALGIIDGDHEKKIAENARLIAAIRAYGWTNADMQRWAAQLSKANRSLEVPDVPQARTAQTN